MSFFFFIGIQGLKVMLKYYCPNVENNQTSKNFLQNHALNIYILWKFRHTLHNSSKHKIAFHLRERVKQQ